MEGKERNRKCEEHELKKEVKTAPHFELKIASHVPTAGWNRKVLAA